MSNPATSILSQSTPNSSQAIDDKNRQEIK